MNQNKYGKMEQYEISKLLNDSTVSRFVTRKRVKVSGLSNGQYSDNKNLRFKTAILRSDLRDYGDVLIVMIMQNESNN